ncbi:cytosine deaminase [Paradevosia shaoguanensis]|uniref:Cytosine deaminase n=1 Tax=Paradevosia shaoguanensis TaxID=1335043 RepID=A0AA41QND7_9HYPH|nr:cytosine deaminase [Paradevosia shaoguanensis]MCI0127014.1 cytosine deaminase [Paradevosia shaoguanensis]
MAASAASWVGGSVVLLNARLPDAARGLASGKVQLANIRIAGGKVIAIGADVTPEPGEASHDCRGGLVAPAFVDVHTHLDKGHIWTRTENPDGSFMGALRSVGADRQAHWSAEDIERRMDFALRCAYAHGTAAIRTHLDSDPAQRVVSWPIFDNMRDAWRGRIELQPVALIGPDSMCDLEEVRAIARWIKPFGGVLGGAIANHPDARTAMANVVKAADEFGLDIDVHCDETLDPEASSLLYLAEATLEARYEGHAQAGHCCSLATQSADVAARTIDKVAEAKVAIVSLPLCNMYLQDRQPEGAVRTPRLRGITLVKELKAAGCTVSVASDNTRDPFYAYGDLDMVEVFRETARIAQIDHPSDDAWDWLRALTALPAASARFAYDGTVAIGHAADLVILHARSWSELHSRPQADRIVVRSGRAIDTSLPDYSELDGLIGAPS